MQKFVAVVFRRSGIEVYPFVEVHDLVDQVDGVGVAIGSALNLLRCESRRRAGPGHCDPHEIEVNQGVFGFFDGEPATNDVGHGFDLVSVHEGGTDADCSGRFRTVRFWSSPGPDFAVDIFFSVVGDVNKGRVERRQCVHGPVDGIDVLPFEWGEQFNAEPAVFRLCKISVMVIAQGFRSVEEDWARASERLHPGLVTRCA